MTPPTLQLRSVFELLGERFFIPSYQRGYRWTQRQVEALLDDLKAFQASSKSKPDAFYCLQPVVVLRRPQGDWEVVDGQQRLTTISLVLGRLKDLAAVLGRDRFEISYETRPGSAEFLNDPSESHAEQNIDFHFMYAAHQAIGRWFDQEDKSVQLRLLDCLTGPDGIGPNVRIIWYELGDGDSPMRAFVRLNVGRIPLTSAELIRAQLLRSDAAPLDSRDREQIPQDWDLIERRLQDDNYWFFLQNGGPAPAARIEYLFDVFVRVKAPHGRVGRDIDPLATFFAFQALLEGKKAWTVWQDFKRVSQTLETWFEDRTLYHLVGFLVLTSTPTEDRSDVPGRHSEASVLVRLLGNADQSPTRSSFLRFLRTLIWRRFENSKTAIESFDDASALQARVQARIDDIDYGAPVAVRAALILFNIAGLLEQSASTQRFQFDGFKNNAWDIEHVRSVAERMPQTPTERTQWLGHALSFVVSPLAKAMAPDEVPALSEQIQELLSTPSPDSLGFKTIFESVRRLSGEPDAREEDNSLCNLALLDMGTNRSYKNAIFPVKRLRIIGLDREGQFVPPATRNVFLKYYSSEPAKLMLWDDDDQKAYAYEVQRTICDFFSPLVAVGEAR